MAHDVVIVGAGPAGMQAAIAAASEGLDVLVLEKDIAGGMIGQTPKLENAAFCGAGLTGPEFAKAMRSTAEKMGAKFRKGNVVGLIQQRSGEKKLAVVFADGGDTVVLAHTVVLALGTKWIVPDVAGLTLPQVKWGPLLTLGYNATGRDVAVYGGGPAAGQAVLALADEANTATAHIVCRSKLTMPQYLIDRITRHPKVKISEDSTLRRVKHRDDGQGADIILMKGADPVRLTVDALFMCNGTTPNTAWVPPAIEKDKDGRILVGLDVGDTEHYPEYERQPDTLETSMPGVYAVGDCRSGSVPRVGVAIGDGSMAVSNIWAYFRRNPVCRRCDEIFRK